MRRWHRRPSKAKSQRRHAKKRFGQRLGLAITNAQLDAAVRAIQGNEARFVERQSLRVTLWELEIAGQTCVVVYDKQRKQIVTTLPTDEISTHGGAPLPSVPNGETSGHVLPDVAELD